MNGYVFGYHLLWLSSVTYFLTKPGHVPSATITECSYIGSLLEFGRLLSCIPCGVMVDRFGRKKTVILAGILNFISSTMLVFSPNLILIFIARLVSQYIFNLVATPNYIRYTLLTKLIWEKYLEWFGLWNCVKKRIAANQTTKSKSWLTDILKKYYVFFNQMCFEFSWIFQLETDAHPIGIYR